MTPHRLTHIYRRRGASDFLLGVFFFKKDNPKAASFSVHLELLRSYLFNFITFKVAPCDQRQRIRGLCFPSVFVSIFSSVEQMVGGEPVGKRGFS